MSRYRYRYTFAVTFTAADDPAAREAVATLGRDCYANINLVSGVMVHCEAKLQALHDNKPPTLVDRVVLTDPPAVLTTPPDTPPPLAPVIHPCCGCSCRVCANGHHSYLPLDGHTDECRERFYSAITVAGL